jgi:hypothetical protein
MLAGWAQELVTLRQRLGQMPALLTEGLWRPQIEAIQNLENSLAQDRPQALIQMAAERQVIAGVYLAKVVDHLQGYHHERELTPNYDRYRNRRVSKAVQEQSLSPHSDGQDASSEDRPQREGQTIGPAEVVGGEITSE